MSTPSKEHPQETANIHIEHYFPKGYDPDKEPWCSIRKFHRSAIEEATEPYKVEDHELRKEIAELESEILR